MKNRLAGILICVLALIIFAENARPGVIARISREIAQIIK